MAKLSDEPLQPNPFRTYRDPDTGLWVVIKDVKTTSKQSTGATIKDNLPTNSNMSII
jgi:hypothetical protein